MKSKVLIIFVLLISIFFINKVEAMPETFRYEETIDILNVNGLVSISNGFLLSSYDNNGTILYSYNSDNDIVAIKNFNNLQASEIINYKGNILLFGVKSNSLVIYLLDSDLRILKIKETSYMVGVDSHLDITIYDNNIYLCIFKNGILSNNRIYEIDDELNVTDNSFSSYNNIEDILSSTYYFIKFNNTVKDNWELSYNSYIKYMNDNILVGNTSNKGVIGIYSDNQLTDLMMSDRYDSYEKVVVIKDMLGIIAKDINNDYYLLLFNKDMEVISEDRIDSNVFFKNGNRLLVDDKIYSYDLDIIYDNGLYGTINVNGTGLVDDRIYLDIVANSGYKIGMIEVTDSYGNIVNYVDNSFVMPDTDVYLTVSYEETVINPDTVDTIVIVVIVLCISGILVYFFYNKYVWLK